MQKLKYRHTYIKFIIRYLLIMNNSKYLTNIDNSNLFDPENQDFIVQPEKKLGTLAQKINDELIEISYYDDVKKGLHYRYKWKKIGDITEAIAKIVSGLSVVFAFASGFFNISYLSFIAGCLGTLSLVLLQFSSYAFKESSERTRQINKILSKLGISSLVDIIEKKEDTDYIEPNDEIIEISNDDVITDDKFTNILSSIDHKKKRKHKNRSKKFVNEV